MNKGCSARALALDLLSRSPCGVMVAAVLSDNNGIFAWGWNHYRTFRSEGSPGIHAEEHALSRANRKRLSGSLLTVAGIRRGGKWVYSRPCEKKCLILAKKHGVTAVEFTTKEGGWEVQKLEYVKT